MKFHKVNAAHSYYMSEDMKMVIDDDVNIPEKFDLRLRDLDLKEQYDNDKEFNINWTGTLQEMKNEAIKLYRHYKK